MHKYADHTYLVVPAASHQSCSSEIDNFEKWAAENNLVLNRKKSVQIVFVASRSQRTVDIPPPAVPSITRVESIKSYSLHHEANEPSIFLRRRFPALHVLNQSKRLV